MIESEFQEILEDISAVIVHFSHFATMNHKVVFPDDLRYAINNPSELRSCCALWPGHRMEPIGSVGLIYEPRLQHVKSVSVCDSGSSELDGEDCSAGDKSLDEANIRASFDVPAGSYNEWRLKEAPIKGIYIADPDNICVKQHIQYELCGQTYKEINAEKISLDKVMEMFPSMDFFTLNAAELICLKNVSS